MTVPKNLSQGLVSPVHFFKYGRLETCMYVKMKVINHSLHPSPLSAGVGWGGGVEPPTKFSKRDLNFDRTWQDLNFERGVTGKEGGG